MKILVAIFIILSISINVFADELTFPFSCYPKELQQRFKDNGYQLDLDANNRTEDSWGFLINRGNEFIIMTYVPVTKETLQDIMLIIQERDSHAK